MLRIIDYLIKHPNPKCFYQYNEDNVTFNLTVITTTRKTIANLRKFHRIHSSLSVKLKQLLHDHWGEAYYKHFFTPLKEKIQIHWFSVEM